MQIVHNLDIRLSHWTSGFPVSGTRPWFREKCVAGFPSYNWSTSLI